LPASLHSVLTKQGISNETFPGYVAALKRDTADRVQAGEGEHFVYFALQSNRFTALPRIEPAVSARIYVERLQRRSIPADADARLHDLVNALDKRRSDPRIAYIAEYFRARAKQDVLGEIQKSYAAAMAFLYEKEFKSAGSEIYQKRGHSTDTQVEANFAVWTALVTLQRLDPALKLNRVLIVGPGLDFAPRTDLIDAFEPQSYQPFAIADALLQLKLAEPREMSIECLDINERGGAVLEWLRARQSQAQLGLRVAPGFAL